MKFTNEHLNRAIANLREPEPEVTQESPWFTAEWRLGSGGTGWVPRHDYLSDANAMLELLTEMPNVDVMRDCRKVWQCYITLVTKTIVSENPDMRIAVAMNYYQWKTGEVVELEKNTE